MAVKLFVATKAFIEHNGKFLVLREAQKYKDGTNTGKYDVIGGRINPGESLEASLKREATEEIGIPINIGKLMFVHDTMHKVRGEDWQIVRIFFHCHTNTDKIKLGEDHDDYKWIHPQNYKEENIIPNLYPGFKILLEKSLSLNELTLKVMQQAKEKGFGTTSKDISVAEKMALLHSEVSEAFEAYRKKNIDGKNGFKEELGDILQRLLHLSGIFHIDLEKEILKKMSSNKKRVWEWKKYNEKHT